MSTTIDSKVVEMQFNNSNFEKNVSTSMSTLEKLKSSLNFDSSSDSFSKLGTAADTISVKFSALEVAAVAALANIVNKAVDAGVQLVESLSVDNIAAGWEKYAEKTQSVGTLISQGYDLDVVNEQLERLNWYTDETSYNFTDMVSNIAKFTASGQDLETSVTAMEGIANWAALSGQNATTASRAMYQLAQAMSVGYMRYEDYKSIQNASMDTEEFRQKCIEAALALGTLEETAEGTYNSLVASTDEFTLSSFTSSLTTGAWLTADVMMEVFNEYSSAVDQIYDYAEEKGITASEAIEELGDSVDEFGLKAFKAAQEARTWADVIDSVKDAVSTGWMNTFEIIFGDYEEAKTLWTDLANAMYDVFAGGAEGRNEKLKAAFSEESTLLSISKDAWEEYAKTNTESLSVFEEALINTAREHGIAIDEMIEQEGSFADSLSHGWLTNDIITDALSNLTTSVETVTTSLEEIEEVANRVILGDFGDGADRIEALTAAGYDYATIQSYVNHILLGTEFQYEELSDAQLENLGYTEEQIEALRELAAQAEATGTPLNELIESLTRPSGRELLVEAFWNLWEAISNLLSQIKAAFREIFPETTAEQIYNFIVQVNEAMARLKEFFALSDEGEPLNKTFADIKSTFKGLFAVLDIVKQALTAVWDALEPIRSALGMVGEEVFDVTGAFGEWLVSLDESIRESGVFTEIAEKVANVLQTIVDTISSAWTPITESFKEGGGGLAGVLQVVFDKISDVIEIVSKLAKAFFGLDISSVTSSMTSAVKKLRDKVVGFMSDIQESFDISSITELLKKLADVISNNLTPVVDSFKEGGGGLTGVLQVIFDKFTDIIGIISDFAQTLFGVDISGFASTIISAVQNIRDKIIGFVTDIDFSSIFQSVKDFISNIKENFTTPGFSLFESILMSIKDTASAAIDGIVNLKDKIISALQNVGSVFDNIGFGELFTVGMGVGFLAIFKKLADAFDNGISPITEILTSVKKAINSFSTELKSQALLNVAIAIGVLVASIVALTLIDQDKIGVALETLAALAIGLVAVSVAMSKLSGISGSASSGIGILATVIALKLFLSIFEDFAELDISGMKSKLEEMAAIIAEFAALALSSNLGGSISKGGGILATVIALKMFISIFEDFAKMDVSGLSAKVKEFAGVIAEFAAVALSSNLGAGISKGVGILATVIALKLFISVFEDIAAMDMEQAKASMESFSELLLMFAALMVSSNLAGSNAAKAGAMLLMISAAILILSGAIVVLSHIEEDGLTRATAAVAVLEAMFAAIIAVTGLAQNCKSTLIIIAVVIALLAVALGALSMIEPDNLETASTALAEVMAMFALMVASTALAKSATGTIVLMALVVAELAAVLYFLSDLPADSVLGVAESLSLLLISLSASLLIISLCGDVSTSAMIALGVMTLVVAGLAVILGLLAYFDVGPTLEIAESLALLLTSLSVSLAIVAAVGKLAGTSAFAGIGALVTLVAALGALMIAIGALVTYVPDLEEFLDKGMSILEDIGYAIGNFFGNIIGGFLGGLTSGLPEMGEDLSGFMENLQGFIDGAKNIDSSTFDGIDSLVGAILKLTAADLLDRFTSAFFGGSTISELGSKLSTFGEALCDFSDSIEDLDDSDISRIRVAANAGKALADMADAIPNMGGLLAELVGDNDMATFGLRLRSFGGSLVDFAESVSTLDADDIASIQAAAEAGEVLADMADAIPNMGGLLADLVGENDMSVFGEQLKDFGEALVEFSASVSTLTTDNIESIKLAAEAGVAVADMASAIPNMGGLLAELVGDNDMATFGEQLKSFGEALVEFSASVSTLTADNIESIKLAAEAGLAVAEMAKAIPNVGGLLADMIGDNDMATFGEQLKSFGEALVSFSESGEGLNMEAMDNAISAGESLAEIASAIPNLGGVLSFFSGQQSMSKFGTQLEKFGEGLMNFYNAVKDVEPSKLDSAISAVSSLIDMASDIDTLESGTLSSFAKDLKSMAKTGVDDFIDAFDDSNTKVKTAVETFVKKAISAAEDKGDDLVSTFTDIVKDIMKEFTGKYTEFQTLGKNVVSKFVTGVENKASTAVSKFTTIMSDCIKEIKSTYSDFKDAGEYLVKGFAAGIDKYSSYAEDAARKMAKAAADAINDELDINSPSKVGAESGGYFGMGFVNELIEYAEKSYDAGAQVASAAKNGLSDAIAKIGQLIDSDIDTEPTIRPVLDLTEVQNKANMISSMFDDSQSIKLSSSIDGENITKIQNGRYGISDNSSTTSNNDDVVEAISALRSDFADMEDAISNLKIVMDSGTLVGQIAGKMDVALGRQAAYEGRGI